MVLLVMAFISFPPILHHEEDDSEHLSKGIEMILHTRPTPLPQASYPVRDVTHRVPSLHSNVSVLIFSIKGYIGASME